MRSRCTPLIQQLPTRKVEQRDRQARAVKNSSLLVLNLCTCDYWLTLFFLTFNLLRSHKLLISVFQILNACINFIYHLQKQEAKTKLQTITNLELRLSLRRYTLFFFTVNLSSCVSVYMNVLRLRTCSFIWNWLRNVAEISELITQY